MNGSWHASDEGSKKYLSAEQLLVKNILYYRLNFIPDQKKCLCCAPLPNRPVVAESSTSIVRQTLADIILRIHLPRLPPERLVVPSKGYNTMVEGTLGITKVCACSDSLLAVDHPPASIVGEEVGAIGRAVEGIVGTFVVAVPVVLSNKTAIRRFVVSC